MFEKLIRMFSEIFGFTKRKLNFKKTEKKEFLKSIEPGTIILTSQRNPGILQKAIRGASDSVWEHALLYFGKSSGKYKILNEIVEAQGEGIIVDTLNKNLGDHMSLIAFTFLEMTPRQFSILKEKAYKMVGKNYDFAELFGHLFPNVKNPDDLKVCSTLCTYSYGNTFKDKAIDFITRIVPKKLDPSKAKPSDLYDGCLSNLKMRMTKFNW